MEGDQPLVPYWAKPESVQESDTVRLFLEMLRFLRSVHDEMRNRNNPNFLANEGSFRPIPLLPAIPSPLLRPPTPDPAGVPATLATPQPVRPDPPAPEAKDVEELEDTEAAAKRERKRRRGRSSGGKVPHGYCCAECGHPKRNKRSCNKGKKPHIPLDRK